jgi:hypothetical protein
MVAIGTMRLVSQPHIRSRGSTRVIVPPEDLGLTGSQAIVAIVAFPAAAR